jgi:phospholipase C
MKRLCAATAVAVLAGLFVVPITSAEATVSHRSRLQHVVVMTQGGRSFDNYFGSSRGVDGIGQVPCQLQATTDQLGCLGVHQITPRTTAFTLRTGAKAQRLSVDGGRMDGFVRAQSRPGADGTAAMGYYPPQALPLLHELAGRGVLFDNWFSGVPGGTLPNDLFDISARPPARNTQIIPTTGWADRPVIFDRLTAAHVSWRIYVQNYEPALTINTAATKQRLGGQLARVPLLSLQRYLGDRALLGHIVDLDHYYRDLESHHLPAVSYIVSTSATETSPRDPHKGQQLMRSVLNGLLASSAWPSSALLAQWDSSGGWYDHVPPPVIDGNATGLRVPAFMISPFIRPGTVSHTRFDAASTLKLIESNFRLAPLATRDRDAADPATLINLGRNPERPALVGVSSDVPVVQPKRSTLILGYLAALTVAVGACVVALRAARRHALAQPVVPQ